MSTAAVAAEAPAPAAKKGGAIKLVLAMVVSAALAGGGSYFFVSQQKPKPAAASAEGEAGEGHAAEGESAEGGKEAAGASPNDYFPLAPQFVVNLNDEEAMRFLQIEVQVIAKKAAAMEAVKLNDPIVRNRLMLLFSSQTYHPLLTRAGKEKLQTDATAEINKVLDEQKKPHINGVVFTNFVMQ